MPVEPTAPKRPKTVVFISHTRTAAAVALVKHLREFLVDENVELRTTGDTASAGEKLSTRISSALKDTDVFLALVDEDSLKHPALFWEIGAASGLGKPVVAVARETAMIKMLPLDQTQDHIVSWSDDPTRTAQRIGRVLLGDIMGAGSSTPRVASRRAHRGAGHRLQFARASGR